MSANSQDVISGYLRETRTTSLANKLFRNIGDFLITFFLLGSLLCVTLVWLAVLVLAAGYAIGVA